MPGSYFIETLFYDAASGSVRDRFGNVVPGLGGSGANLSFSRTATTLTVESDTGLDATLPAFTSTLSGIVPSPQEVSTTKFLRADGTWSAPAGGGDMLKSENLSGLANNATARTNLGVAIGSDVQAFHANLSAFAGLTIAADKLPYGNGAGTLALADFTAGGRALVNSAGTADTFPYFSASDTVTLGTLTAAGRALLDDANASAQRATLGAAPDAAERIVESTTARTLTSADNGKIIYCTNAGATTITVPAAFFGYHCMVVRAGAGSVTIAASGTTLESVGGALAINAQHGAVSITSREAAVTNTFTVAGALGTTGSGDVVGPASAVDSEMVLFDGTTGKLVKRASGNGVAVGTSGVISFTTSPTLANPRVAQLHDTNGNELFIFTATASAVNEVTYANAATGTNPTFSATGGDTNIGINFAPKGTGHLQYAGTEVGYRLMPLASHSAPYEFVLTDRGKGFLHPTADTTARTWTIPANASVAFPVGTVLTFFNQSGAGVITIAITTDTMRLAGSGSTGSRSLAANGIAVATKLAATEWIISGTGLT